MNNEYFTTFYLDKERDIVVNLYKNSEDELTYVIETPNHSTGNLITSLAKVSGKGISKNEKDLKIITGTIPASINSKNEDVYIFRLGGYKVANIYADRGVQLNGQIPAIIKTLMSQTKDYKLPIEKTIVKSYILKKLKFKTDLHTHMNANLSPDCLVALGIKHQIRYPLYYIKKLNLKLSKEQEEKIYEQRKKVEKEFSKLELEGKKLERKIDDNTFINFADFILNNLENAKENLEKVTKSLVILKDGQAVFTNLEKLYLYRYAFTRGIESQEKIVLEENLDKIESIPIKEIKEIVLRMVQDLKKESPFANNTLRKDKLLWIAREYQKQGIKYTEIADTVLTKKGLPAIELLEDIHEIMPKIEEETGVKIRFLFAIRRIPLTIINEDSADTNYLKENLVVLKAISKSPYVVGCDFIGEEINDITELKPLIEKIVEYVKDEDEDYTIRIHAGENDSLKDNVENSIKCVKDSLRTGQNMPRVRIGHGLYTPDLNSEKGKQLVKDIIDSNAIMEFQITSNVRLNNLTELSNHPLKKYLAYGVNCVQGTDGHGFYGVDTIDEQLALQNILGLTEEELEQMRKVEDEVIEHSNKYFEEKTKRLKEFLSGRSLREAILAEEKRYEEESESIQLRIVDKVPAKENLDINIVSSLPLNKMPIVVAGGSFNAKGIYTSVEEQGKQILEKLVEKINPEKAYFVIGHQMMGYEKLLLEICEKLNKNFEIYAIIPKLITEEERERLVNTKLTGICISIESDGSGIYKSFNYEIFERRSSIVLAFDGNSPVSNLVQEAKNGKGKAKIYVNSENENLRQKAKNLEGYVKSFNLKDDVASMILNENNEMIQ